MHAIAEVAVRFAGDLIAVAHVPHGGSYRVGVDFALAVEPFPLVTSTRDGFVVQASAGARAARLDAGSRIDVALDQVSFAIQLVARPGPVARARIEARPLVFAAASLAAHLAVWSLAMVEPEPEVVAVEAAVGDGATRIARYAAPAQTVRRAPRRPPDEVPITTAVTEVPHPTIEPPARAQVASRGAPGLAITDRGRLHDTSSADRGERTSRHFDPASNPDLDTIKSGAYSTIATGRAAGEHYGAEARRRGLVVVSCDEASCLVIGGDDAAPIRRAVERRLADITACYRGSKGGKVELDFGLTAGGTVDDLAIGGIGDVGSCVATIFRAMHIGGE